MFKGGTQAWQHIVMQGEFFAHTIRDAMTQKIKNAFPNAHILTEPPAEGMAGPFFFVLTVKKSLVKRQNNRYQIRNEMAVRFLGEDTTSLYSEAEAVGASLFFLLDEIDLPAKGTDALLPTRAETMEMEIDEETASLSMKAVYQFAVEKYIPPKPKMQTNEITEKLKED